MELNSKSLDVKKDEDEIIGDNLINKFISSEPKNYTELIKMKLICDKHPNTTLFFKKNKTLNVA